MVYEQMASSRRISSAEVLSSLGYDYVSFTIPPELPDLSEIRFKDLLPEFAQSSSPTCRKIAEMRLYSHQVRALEALRRGDNLVLKSGTGSGKTEAWFLRAALDEVRTLAVYPTLALANDQFNRLREYCSALGWKVMALDALKRDELVKRIGYRELRKEISEAHIMLTNPAFLLNELKKIGAGKTSLLKPFLEKAGLLVIDDFDFYGPRSIALLFSMVKLIVKIVNPKLQLAFMTAALENPEEVAEYLTSINGRRTSIVDGKAFHPKNSVYIILGKNLKAIWEKLRKQLKDFEEVGEDVKRALSSFEVFKKNYFKVMEVAKSLGVDVPEESVDVAEVLEKYVEDEGATIVFTRNIARAEEIAKRLKLRLGGLEKVAPHHHLLSKSQREEIEEKVRRGEIKILTSPRTLSQGIDIGLVRRIVHVGLPDSIREFRQREGRKGRRPEIEETETVIFPQGIWDRELLTRGVEAFKKWMTLPQEKIIVNKDNLYGRLFEALFKYLSPILRKELTRDELKLLRDLGLESDGELTRRGKMTWLKMNFYEFAPAFGIKRIRLTKFGEMERLEDISHVDLVEKFQPGCIDYSSDGIVVEHKLGGKSARTVTAVYIEDLNESVLRRHDSLAYVLEEYEKAKWRWGETPNLRRDYLTGKIHTDVKCVVHAPSSGFGLYTKIPNRVLWRILSDKRMVKVIGERTLPIRESRVIEVPTPTYGMYSDYTYGISFEVDPEEDVELLRLGLAFLMIALRRILGIAFDTIKYDIMVMGERKVIGIHETESAGILYKIDWMKFSEEVSKYQPDELDEIFLEEVDELAYSSFVSLKLDWSIVKKQALKILNYLILKDRILLRLGEAQLSIPKPSKSLKLASIAAVDLTLREDLKSGLYGVAIYDGEDIRVSIGVKELGQPEETPSNLISDIASLIDEGFKILVYDSSTLDSALDSAGLKAIKATLSGLKSMNKLIEVRERIAKAFGEPVALDFLEDALKLERRVSLKDLIYYAEEEKRRIPHMAFIRSLPKRLSQRIRDFLEAEVKNLYTIYLVSEEILKKAAVQES